MAADGLAGGDVFFGDGISGVEGSAFAEHAVHGPGEVDGGGAGIFEDGGGGIEWHAGFRGQPHAVGGGGADAAGAADVHVPDGGGDIFHGVEVFEDERPRELALIDDAHGFAGSGRGPDGAGRSHGGGMGGVVSAGVRR